MTFGQKLEIRRKERGYTQTELAERMIAKISTALNISVDYLIFGAEEK